MQLDKLVNFVIQAVAREEERDKPTSLHAFKVTHKARSLIAPANACAKHHRDREKHYTTELGKAEKKLRAKGIDIEAYDWAGGFALDPDTHVVSGSITGGQKRPVPA